MSDSCAREQEENPCRDARLTATDEIVSADQIVLGMLTLWEPGAVGELRILGTGRGTVAGYFDDLEKLAAAAIHYDGMAEGIYATLNPVPPELLARANNRVKEYTKITTADNQIQRRCWLLIDCDPVRPSGISSTDAEHEAALARARQVREWLVAHGWPRDAQLLADSGNGAHVLARIALPNDAESKDLVERLLKALAFRFDDDAVKIDTKVGKCGTDLEVLRHIGAEG
jgi:hypothetical protein